MALGVAGGYLLGRTKKMKLALMFAGMAAGRRAGGPGELLKGGTKLLSSTPELARLTDQVRGRLLEAGKSAALAVAARQVESITDRVGRRVESLGDVGVPRQRRSDEAADEAERDEYDDEPPADDDRDDGRDDDGDDRRDEAPADEEAPATRRRPARARAAKSSGGTTTVRRTTGSATRAAGGAGKAATGGRTQRKPRTRRSEGDG